jgi:hypothetical protein
MTFTNVRTLLYRMEKAAMVLFFVCAPAAAKADFTFGDFKYEVTFTTGFVAVISGYTGPGGDVTIPASINPWPVTGIAESAFAGCNNITKVSVPAGISYIEAFAFQGCSSLTNITIPDTVVSIAAYSFVGCPSLSTIAVDEHNPTFSSAGCVLFNKDRTVLIQSADGTGGDYLIPNGITSIAQEAFVKCVGLSNVAFPESLRRIDDFAFMGCINLTAANIPSGVTNVGAWAFAYCDSLTNLTIPNSVTTLGSSMVSGCTNLTSVVIPNGITSLAGVFNSSGLINVTIPAGVTNLSSAFAYCHNLTNVAIPQGVTEIGYQAFRCCSSLGNLIIPQGVTSIGQDAFDCCTSLTNIVLPDSLTNLVDDTFGSCPLRTITIPKNVRSMGYGIFYDCVNLTGVFFEGDAPTNLGVEIFHGATNATVYYLPDTTGWSTTFVGRPTALWRPQIETSADSLGVKTNGFGFTMSWAKSETVVVDACTDLTSASWVPLETNTLTFGTHYFSDSQWKSYSRRLYRVRWLQQDGR